VITRAMAMGKPVIAARIGAIPRLSAKRIGLLFQMGNADEIAHCVRTLYNDPERCKQMGLRGREKATAKYHPEVVYERLMEIYQRASHAV